MAAGKNRLEAPWLDAALHLLDRQVLAVDGRMICKVDDLEISEPHSGDLAVTGLLVGPAALWPRLSGVLGDWLRDSWVRLGIQYVAREVPSYLDLALVEAVGSAVTLSVERDGVLDRQPDADDGTVLHRAGDLLGMKVRTPGGESLGKVLDIRLEPRGRGAGRRLALTHLIVGRGRPGSLLGYDRGDFRGPLIVRWLVLRMHRHTGKVSMDAVDRIDWENAHLTVKEPPEPLTNG